MCNCFSFVLMTGGCLPPLCWKLKETFITLIILNNVCSSHNKYYALIWLWYRRHSRSVCVLSRHRNRKTLALYKYTFYILPTFKYYPSHLMHGMRRIYHGEPSSVYWNGNLWAFFCRLLCWNSFHIKLGSCLNEFSSLCRGKIYSKVIPFNVLLIFWVYSKALFLSSVVSSSIVYSLSIRELLASRTPEVTRTDEYTLSINMTSSSIFLFEKNSIF